MALRRRKDRVPGSIKPERKMRDYAAFQPEPGGLMKSYMCVICGFVYNEADGLPDEGIVPGTKWNDVPPNWVCPDCGARKEDFEMVEI
jgi:rubredoxin